LKKINDTHNKRNPEQQQETQQKNGSEYDEYLMRSGVDDEKEIRSIKNRRKVFKRWAVCILGACLIMYGLVGLKLEIPFLLRWEMGVYGIKNVLYAAGFLAAGVNTLIAGIFKMRTR